MNDTDYAAQKERIQRVLFPLKDILLNDWVIAYEFNRTPNEDEAHTMARCRPLFEYKRATIEIYVPILAEQDDETILETLVHEMVHCYLDLVCDLDRAEGDDSYRKLVELTTVTVTNGIMAMYRTGESFGIGRDDDA